MCGVAGYGLVIVGGVGTKFAFYSDAWRFDADTQAFTKLQPQGACVACLLQALMCAD